MLKGDGVIKMPAKNAINNQRMRSANKDPAIKTLPGAQSFVFPVAQHLLITTPSRIFVWDCTGIKTVFQSRKRGIRAAVESKDGSGILAIADKHVVVLHDTKRRQERSWGLDADADEVRHLEYTADARSLFLSTRLTCDIQQYSTDQLQMLEPTRAHATPPVAMGVSPTGHLMVSASDHPPIVYMRNIFLKTSPVMLEPRASRAAVSVIAFHPERPNIFLLAFRDGALAAFDAMKVSRRAGPFANQEAAGAGETARFSKLHRGTVSIDNAASITSAAFLPGYKTRAVTVGNDGRCRIVDFDNGGVVLRTWHAKAPVTCVSVLALKAGVQRRSSSAGSRASHLIGGPTSTNNLIAIGRVDGKVHLYDSVGLLLEQISLGEGERILSVEWAKGESPRPIAGTTAVADNAPEIPPPQALTSSDPRLPTSSAPDAFGSQSAQTQARRETFFDHVGLPPALRKPKEAQVRPLSTTPAPVRQFTVHPDEEQGTVRHTPMAGKNLPTSIGKGEYLDLFSPVKRPEERALGTARKAMASPPRSRPRMTSQTFIKSPQACPPSPTGPVASPRNLALFPSTDSHSEVAAARVRKPSLATKGSKKHSSVPERRITFKPSERRRSHKSAGFQPPRSPQPNNNARLLADLRKMSITQPQSQHSGGILSSYGGTSSAPDVADPGAKCGRGLLHRPADQVDTDQTSLRALKIYDRVHKTHWVDDSNQESSIDGDIWLTSESGSGSARARRRRPTYRSPARQTSRSRVNSKGTASTVARPSHSIPVVDGSTGEELRRARSHISPSGTFTPSSHDVRELFPRSSSLSPSKSKRRPRAKRTREDRALEEMAVNAADERASKDPQARAKVRHEQATLPPTAAGSSAQLGMIFEDPVSHDAGDSGQIASSRASAADAGNPARVHRLESDVTRLRGEVLALKAVLRRYGLPEPAGLRHT